MKLRTVRIGWRTNEEQRSMIMPTASGSLKYLFWGLLAFLVMSGLSGAVIQRIPTGDIRGAVGLPFVMLTFGVLLYALHRGERHTWEVISHEAEGIPVFYSFGICNTMLLGAQKGWVGYGCLKRVDSGAFVIESKYKLRVELIGSSIESGLVLIENRKQVVACVTFPDGKQLMLWQPGRNICPDLEVEIGQTLPSDCRISGMPKFEDWPVLVPTKLTTKGLWPTALVVGLLQCGLVYTARLADMPQVAWLPVGVVVAPFIYLLFEGAGRPRRTTFGELLERQIIAKNVQ